MGKNIKIIDNRKDWGVGDYYEGEVNAEDIPDGQGKLIHKGVFSSDNYVYVGEFKGGKKHGHGVLTVRECSLDIDENKYDGEWKNDLRDGFGVQTYGNGDCYEGQWKDDNYHGKGKLTEKNGSVYDGEWMKGRRQGYGIQVYYDGDRYEGQWEDDRRCGRGTLAGKDGTVYEDVVFGRNYAAINPGKIRYPDGGIYEGDLRGCERHGIGVMTYADGRVESGRWLENEFIDEEALCKSAEFSFERINDFRVLGGCTSLREYSDLTVREGALEAGFMVDGRIRGFMWKHEWDDMGSDTFTCGLCDERKWYYTFLCSVTYEHGGRSFRETEYMLPGLIECDDMGRIVFCGMHKDGMRHGLGSEFSYVDGKIVEVQGLWQNGVFTHRRVKDKLVPVQ